MVGRPGRRGARGEVGDVGDSICPKPSSSDIQINQKNQSIRAILNKKLSVTTFDYGLSLSYNPISNELPNQNHKTARFAVNNLISQRPIYIKNDNSNPGKYLMVLDDTKNQRQLYLSISREPINKTLKKLGSDDYFPPSDYMGVFSNKGIPLIIKGTSDHCLIEIDFEGNRFALIREKRNGIGLSVERGQYALIFRRNGKPTPLRLKEIDKYQGLREIPSRETEEDNFTKPIYQYHNSEKNDYLFIDDVSEVPSGYNYQGLAFRISEKSHNNAKPLYLCYNSRHDKHFLSNQSKCSDVSYQGSNKMVKLLGFLNRTGNSQSLKRCFNPGLESYMSQKESLIRNCLEFGFNPEKELGFL